MITRIYAVTFQVGLSSTRKTVRVETTDAGEAMVGAASTPLWQRLESLGFRLTVVGIEDVTPVDTLT